MMDAARTEAALRDLEAAAFAEQHVVGRHAHIVQDDFRVAMRRVVETENGEHAHDLDALGVDRHEDLRLLLVALGGRVGLAHHDRDLAARIADARRPPFAAVNDIFVAVARDRGFDVGGVRRGDAGLGHQEGGADLAGHQRLQPLVLLLLRAVAVEHFHVAGVGRGAVEHFGRPGDLAHLLGTHRIFEIGETGAVIVALVMVLVRWQEQVPQALGLRLLLQILEDLHDLPAVRPEGFHLLVVDFLRRIDMLVHEGDDTIPPMALAVGHGEIHGCFLSAIGMDS